MIVELVTCEICYTIVELLYQYVGTNLWVNLKKQMNSNNKFYITESGRSACLSPSLFAKGTQLHYLPCIETQERGLLTVYWMSMVTTRLL